MISRFISKEIRASKKSILLLGPRQVGKSTLVDSCKPDLHINLADESEFFNYSTQPGAFRSLIEKSSFRTISVDEIQRIPGLLNTIQAILDENKSLKFFITGSSARKLKRGGANLLPGRVIAHRLGPFVAAEFDYQMNTKRALEEGTLPEAYLLDREHETRALLRSYAAIYLKEEVKAEALVRNLEAFGRFFSCISMSVAGFVDYTKLARRAKVSRHSIPNYFEILEDTLIGERLFALPDFHRLDLIRHPRFYLFDNGVFNALMGNFTASPDRIGTLAEQLVYSQIRHSSWSRSKDVKIHTFRERSGVEVDFVVEIDGTLNAIEVKASERIEPADLEGLEFFDREVRHPSKRLFVFHLGEKEYQFKKAWALPWQKGLKEMGL